MTAVLKLVLMGIFFLVALLLAYKLYLVLNNKIMESGTWLQLAGWSLLLLGGLGALFMSTIYLLIIVYAFLAAAPQ